MQADFVRFRRGRGGWRGSGSGQIGCTLEIGGEVEDRDVLRGAGGVGDGEPDPGRRGLWGGRGVKAVRKWDRESSQSPRAARRGGASRSSGALPVRLRPVAPERVARRAEAVGWLVRGCVRRLRPRSRRGRGRMRGVVLGALPGRGCRRRPGKGDGAVGEDGDQVGVRSGRREGSGVPTVVTWCRRGRRGRGRLVSGVSGVRSGGDLGPLGGRWRRDGRGGHRALVTVVRVAVARGVAAGGGGVEGEFGALGEAVEEAGGEGAVFRWESGSVVGPVPKTACRDRRGPSPSGIWFRGALGHRLGGGGEDLGPVGVRLCLRSVCARRRVNSPCQVPSDIGYSKERWSDWEE